MIGDTFLGDAASACLMDAPRSPLRIGFGQRSTERHGLMSRDVILVTGGAGFIGSNFVEYLLERTRYIPVVLDRFDEFSVQRYNEKLVRVIPHDLRHAVVHAGTLEQVADRVKYVVHMAAGSHVDRSITDPVGFAHDNVIGTVNLFEYVRRHLCPDMTLYFSTDEVFGAAAPGETFHEFDRHEPNNPYAAAKSGGEALCPAYANTYQMPICVTHCSNAYGPLQHLEKFVPLCIDKISRGETVLIHSRDAVPSSRMYLHVTDVCRAVQLILECGDTIECGKLVGRYNIAGNDEYSNLLVAQEIARHLELPLEYELVESVPNRPRHDQRYSIGWDRLHALGWEPRIGLDAGLKSVCEAYRRAA